jgi:hypothetical protein
MSFYRGFHSLFYSILLFFSLSYKKCNDIDCDEVRFLSDLQKEAKYLMNRFVLVEIRQVIHCKVKHKTQSLLHMLKMTKLYLFLKSFESARGAESCIINCWVYKCVSYYMTYM